MNICELGSNIPMQPGVYDEGYVIYPCTDNLPIRMKEEGRMTVSQIMEKMISFSQGNIHDIDHFIRVWTYAKTIGELEKLDKATQFILEVSAMVHDIACPLCREKYGNTNGKYQEKESEPIVREF